MAEKDEEAPTIAEDLVVTKYKMASEITNRVLKELLAKCVDGASVVEIGDQGDKRLAEETAKVFKKEKEVKKGIAFPTCLSINHCICHYSPLKSEPDSQLKNGDLVKIDLGCHIDGFIAVVAHSIVVGASKDNKVTGRKADVILAAYQASECALRLVKPGSENDTVTDHVAKVAEEFKCKPVEGMLSHQLVRNQIDGEKTIILNPNESQKKEHKKCEFEIHEVYGVDVLVSTGEGKGRETEVRTTVYKKKDLVYNLKMKTSRAFFSDVDKRFGTMPFTLRACDDEKKAKMGVIECVKHELLQPFPVLWEREGEFVAQFKFTVLLMPNGPMKITGLPLEADFYESEFSIKDEAIKNMLATSTSRKTAKKKKKKAEKAMLDTGNAQPATGNGEDDGDDA